MNRWCLAAQQRTATAAAATSGSGSGISGSGSSSSSSSSSSNNVAGDALGHADESKGESKGAAPSRPTSLPTPITTSGTASGAGLLHAFRTTVFGTSEAWSARARSLLHAPWNAFDRLLVLDTRPKVAPSDLDCRVLGAAWPADRLMTSIKAPFGELVPSAAELDRLAAVCRAADMSVRMTPAQKWATLAAVKRAYPGLHLPTWLARRIFDYCYRIHESEHSQGLDVGSLGFHLFGRKQMPMVITQGNVLELEANQLTRGQGGLGYLHTLAMYVPTRQLCVVALTLHDSRRFVHSGKSSYFFHGTALRAYTDRLRQTAFNITDPPTVLPRTAVGGGARRAHGCGAHKSACARR